MAKLRAQTRRPMPAPTARGFNYELDYKKLNLRENPELYRVGKGEQGVLMIEPYKSEILKYWKFKTPEEARVSAIAIMKLFRAYKRAHDFVGMDMARKFLQMGFTRARRYANHPSGRKYGSDGKMLPLGSDIVKARAAQIFYGYWKRAEADKAYSKLKLEWKQTHGEK